MSVGIAEKPKRTDVSQLEPSDDPQADRVPEQYQRRRAKRRELLSNKLRGKPAQSSSSRRQISWAPAPASWSTAKWWDVLSSKSVNGDANTSAGPHGTAERVEEPGLQGFKANNSKPRSNAAYMPLVLQKQTSHCSAALPLHCVASPRQQPNTGICRDSKFVVVNTKDQAWTRWRVLPVGSVWVLLVVVGDGMVVSRSK